MTDPFRVLLVSGSLRPDSSNTTLLRTASACAPSRLAPVLFEGLGALPHFDPGLDTDPVPPAVVALRHALQEADAVVVSTPEYAHALPGSFKNLFDWAAASGHFEHKPVAWVNTSTSSSAARYAHESLCSILAYCGAVLVPGASGHLPVSRQTPRLEGRFEDTALTESLKRMLGALVEYLDAPGSSAEPSLRGLDHVSINVVDVDAALRFYVDGIGLKVRSDRPDLPFGGAWLDVGAQQVHLIEATPPSDLGQHLALLVTNLDGFVARLRKEGYEVTDPSGVGTSRQAFLSDPSGNLVELHERAA